MCGDSGFQLELCANRGLCRGCIDKLAYTHTCTHLIPCLGLHIHFCHPHSSSHLGSHLYTLQLTPLHPHK